MAGVWDEHQQQQHHAEDMNEEEEDDDEEDILDMGGGGDGGIGGAPNEAEQREALLMRFCPNDSSMLYPEENRATRSLQYGCRLCSYKEQTPDQPLIYRYDLKKEVGNILHTVPSAVADDPTLPRSYNASCTNCGNNEAVFFMSDSAQADSLALIFVCCNCGHKWVG